LQKYRETKKTQKKNTRPSNALDDIFSRAEEHPDPNRRVKKTGSTNHTRSGTRGSRANTPLAEKKKKRMGTTINFNQS